MSVSVNLAKFFFFFYNIPTFASVFGGGGIGTFRLTNQ